MNQIILDTARAWEKNPYFHQKDREELTTLLSDATLNAAELTERFYRDLEFGTGGLRAPVGMGSNRMNRYNVRRASQAIATAVLKNFGKGPSVISYDSRNFSLEFAQEVASVFAGNGLKVYLFKQLTPTPMLSFAVRYFKAHCGVMITASHNPPIYNGLKAFWSDGAQVIPPTDEEIINEYNNLKDWSLIHHLPFNEGVQQGLISWTEDDVTDAYYEMVEKKVIQDLDLCKNYGEQLSVVYTALHGSAEVPCGVLMKRIGFKNFYSIPEQSTPDGNFPTVTSPNPEDPKAMKLAIETMMTQKKDIAFGTDPDGDRLGVVVNHRGSPVILNGNQIGALFIYYLFMRMDEAKTIPSRPLVIKSIVTSPLQDAIVKHYGGTVMETLTGFKWMAGLIRELEEKNSPFNFIFASEESFGYMPHKEARDKDGVSSLALMSEAALYFKKKGMTLVDALEEIYHRFGLYYESLLSLDYEGIQGGNKIHRIMDGFRQFSSREFAGEMIVAKDDFLTSKSFNYLNQKESSINLPRSNVLSFTFEHGDKIFLRPSGTEPKIKFYTMVRETRGTMEEKKVRAMEKIKKIENAIREVCGKI